jgi:hypothetical protein
VTSFISLFSGAGGLDSELERAGWCWLFATDYDRASIRTLEASQGLKLGGGYRAFHGTLIKQADVRDLTGAAMAICGSGRSKTRPVVGVFLRAGSAGGCLLWSHTRRFAVLCLWRVAVARSCPGGFRRGRHRRSAGQDRDQGPLQPRPTSAPRASSQAPTHSKPSSPPSASKSQLTAGVGNHLRPARIPWRG